MDRGHVLGSNEVGLVGSDSRRAGVSRVFMAWCLLRISSNFFPSRTAASRVCVAWCLLRALTASDSACGAPDGVRSRCPFAVAIALGRCLRTILGVKRGNWFGPVMNPDVTARKKVDGAGYPMQACTNRTYVALSCMATAFASTYMPGVPEGGGIPSVTHPRSRCSGTCHNESRLVRVPARMGVGSPSL